MAEKHITKISAKPASTAPEKPQETTEAAKRTDTPVKGDKPKEALKSAKKSKIGKQDSKKDRKKAVKSKQQTPEKPLKEVFLLARPFVALGRYIRDSWRELRQVRWPSRKATWKMTLAVLAYCAMLMVFILLLDMLFNFIFELIIGK